MALGEDFSQPTAESFTARVEEGHTGEAIALRASGSQRPLFLAHDGSGSVEYARELLPHLDAEIPLYALPAASATEPRLRTVEGMATRMVRMIREVQPEGPYRLAGWAFGGLLAYEAAAQLIGRDQGVEFVGMIDTRHPADARAAAGDPGFGHALREHFPQPLPIPVHLFPAEASAGTDPRRGWGAVVPDASLRVTPVPGTHPGALEGDGLRALGEALSREIALASAGRKALPEDGYEPLMTLRFGRSGAPLFCVPGAGASVAGFAELSGDLEPGRPVHAFQPRGVDGEMVPHSTVQAAAELYLRALHQAQPTGPVHLLGHSFGGWVVFEMALRLRAAGRTVGSLTILDSEVPDEDPAHIEERDDREAVLELVEIFEQAAERSLEIASDDVAPLDEAGRLALLHERLVRVGMMPRRSGPDVLRGSFRTFATCLRTTYTPGESYPDPVRLVLVRDPRRDEEANQRMFAESVAGWTRLAPRLVFSEGAGNHVTALKSPHVRSLAAWLDADAAGGAGAG